VKEKIVANMEEDYPWVLTIPREIIGLT